MCTDVVSEEPVYCIFKDVTRRHIPKDLHSLNVGTVVTGFVGCCEYGNEQCSQFISPRNGQL